MQRSLDGCTVAGVAKVWMQWVPWTNCALCPLLAVSCDDTGLGLFTLTVSSPRMDCRPLGYRDWQRPGLVSLTTSPLYPRWRDGWVPNETCSKVCIGKNLSDNFPIQNRAKHGEALSSLLFNSASEYAMRKIQENQEWKAFLTRRREEKWRIIFAKSCGFVDRWRKGTNGRKLLHDEYSFIRNSITYDILIYVGQHYDFSAYLRVHYPRTPTGRSATVSVRMRNITYAVNVRNKYRCNFQTVQ
jgi:hypothetical protein